MSRSKSAFWGAISSQASMIIFMLLSIVLTPWILKFLNKEEYGFYTILFQIIGYLSMLDFGLSGALTRSLAANRGQDESSKLATNKIISTSFFTYSVLGAIVILVGVIFTPYVPQFFKMDKNLYEVAISVTLTLSVFVGIQFPIKVLNSIFYAHQRQLLSNVVGFTINFFNSFLPILFLYLGQGLWSFVYTNIIGSLVEIFATFLLIRKYYPFLKIRLKFFDRILLSQLFNYGFFLFLNAMAVQVVFFTDRFFIGSFVSLSAATMYALTAKAPELSRELIFRITDNAFPAMVEINTKDGEKKLREIHQKLLLITTCLATMAFWMILIFNHWFIQLWVGEGFFAGKDVLLLTLFIMFQHAIIHVSAVALNGVGLVKGLSMLSIVEALINLILTFIFGKIYGIKGILIATIIATWSTAVWYVPYAIMKYLGIRFKEYLFKMILIPILSLSVVGVFLYYMIMYISTKIHLNWFNFLFIVFISTLIFGLFIWEVFLKKELSAYIPARFKRHFRNLKKYR